MHYLTLMLIVLTENLKKKLYLITGYRVVFIIVLYVHKDNSCKLNSFVTKQRWAWRRHMYMYLWRCGAPNCCQVLCLTLTTLRVASTQAMILLPPRPVSLMHKHPQRRKIIHEMHSMGHRTQSMIDWFEDVLVEYPVHVISVAVVEKCNIKFIFY